MVDMEQVQAFDQAVRRNIGKGQPPEEAVSQALEESGLELSAERRGLLIRALNLAELQARDPQFQARVESLTTQIRKLAKGGMTIKKAVEQAQADTGVKLGERGQAMLIQSLEEESARLEGTVVEVVSDKEFAEMQQSAKCVPVEGQRGGWLCCRCSAQGHGTLSASVDRSCRACHHPRCDLQ